MVQLRVGEANRQHDLQLFLRKGGYTLWSAGAIVFFSLTCFLPEFQEELLVKDEGHTTDLLHFGLCCGVPVDKVSSDGDGQLPAKLLAAETCREEKRNLSNESCRGKQCFTVVLFLSNTCKIRQSDADSNQQPLNLLATVSFSAVIVKQTQLETVYHCCELLYVSANILYAQNIYHTHR